MAYNLKDKLVVAVSSRALFNLEKENEIFQTKGLDAYYKYQLENENTPLEKGVGYRIVENLLQIKLPLQPRAKTGRGYNPFQK